ncbi:MAG: M23 family metallopeptidase [Desulfocapsaceae bacterium]|nr:M23 family metallopeptidase [Desulfocapsaceae bacterium]
MALSGKAKAKKGNFLKIFILICLAFLIAAGVYVSIVFFEKSPPVVKLDVNNQYLGKSGEFTVSASDDESGLQALRMIIKQKDKEHVLFEKQFPRSSYTDQAGPATFSEKVLFEFEGSGLENGEAELILTVNDFSLRNTFSGNLAEIRTKLIIDTIPPKIGMLHAERYIRNGGSGIVIYEITGDVSRHGAEIDGFYHGGHPVGDGRDNVYIAYIALPYDAEGIGKAAIIAEDVAGNSSSYVFSPVFQQEKKKADRINITDGFLSAKIPEFSQHHPEMTGNMKEKYLHTNRIIRQKNNAAILELCSETHSERMWEDRFLRMAGASRSGFADYRTYFYKGKEIDRQVHLGMDIASTRRAEVQAANGGKVVFADYLGIYGNMILLDHGQGVFSLYSHLSKIDVAVGDGVDKGTVIGLTGKTGMAGGDHLHFSMLVNGVFVTPKEWWDQQWIEVTIEEPLVDSRF